MQKPQHRGRGRRTGLLIAGIVLAVVAGAYLTARAVYGPDFMSKVFASNDPAKDPHAGKVSVLVSPTVIPAFTAMDPFGLIDAKTGEYHVSWVSEKIANEDKMIRDPNLLRGRVLRRDKQPWRAFSEADFFPPGSQASPTSALKPGQRGVTLSPDKIEGLAVLKRFDRFDLFAVKSRPEAGGPGAGTYVDPEVKRAQEANKGWASDRILIAADATVLEPLPASSIGATAPRTLFAAMTIEESNTLAVALEKGAKIFCNPRTGQPGGDATPLPTAEPSVPVDSIDVINGSKESTIIVPAKSETN